MKKILVLGLAAMSTFALTGCDAIKDFLNMEKEYTCTDFKALLADRKLSFTDNKAVATIDKDGETSTTTYTYNADEKTWEYPYTMTILGETIDMTGSTDLDVISHIKSCELAAALIEKKVDDIFKFYANKDSYRITGEYKTDSQQNKIEYKYRSDGLITSRYEKTTDLNQISSKETKITYAYSKVSKDAASSASSSNPASSAA